MKSLTTWDSQPGFSHPSCRLSEFLLQLSMDEALESREVWVRSVMPPACVHCLPSQMGTASRCLQGSPFSGLPLVATLPIFCWAQSL